VVKDDVDSAACIFSPSLEAIYSQNTDYYSPHTVELFHSDVTSLYLTAHWSMDPRAHFTETSHLYPFSSTLLELVLKCDERNPHDFVNFRSLCRLVTLVVCNTPYMSLDTLLLPPTLLNLSIQGEWVINDQICQMAFSTLTVLHLECHLEFKHIGLSRLSRLRRLSILAPSELHSRLLPPPDVLEEFVIHTFEK